MTAPASGTCSRARLRLENCPAPDAPCCTRSLSRPSVDRDAFDQLGTNADSVLMRAGEGTEPGRAPVPADVPAPDPDPPDVCAEDPAPGAEPLAPVPVAPS